MAALSAVVVTAGGVWADDWPQWRGLNRDGVSAETNWLVNWPPVPVWTQRVGLGYSAVSVSEGRLYTMGMADERDTVYCLDAIAGTQIWSHTYPCAYEEDGYMREFPGPRATPTVDGDRVYTYGHLGQLYCFDKRTGGILWSNVVAAGRPAYGHSGSPLVEGNLLVLNAGKDGVALHKLTGSNVWHSGGAAYSGGYSSPFVINWDSQRVAVLFTYSGLDGVNVQTGARVWWYATSSHFNVADPVAHGDDIFITNIESGESSVMSLTNGLLARRPLDLPLYSQFASPLLLGDHLYGFDALDTLVCVDIRDGTAAWATNVAGATEAGVGEGGIIAADGKLIVVGDNGDLGILSASPAYDDGGRPFVRIVPRAEDEQWHTAPVLANGYIYCRSRHGTLACLRVGAPPGDQDEDGMADNWEQRHFGNTNNCAPDLDSDADSYRNSEEYIAGTDPTNRESRLSVRVEPLGDGVRVSWPARPADGVGYEGKARRYDLEQRASLVTGAWQAVAGRTNIPAVDGQLGHTDSDAASRRFYRVKARLEP